MATAEKFVPASALAQSSKRDSREILLEKASNEFVFAVVGHVGSGTSMVAKTLQELLREKRFSGQTFDTEILKARDVIEDWARKQGKQLPPRSGERLIKHVQVLQDYGDQMRGELRSTGTQDHVAIARGLVLRIRRCRADKLGVTRDALSEVMPDGKPRAYILDCLRHPAEVNMLRRIYGDSFVLIGVVCEEEKRIGRIAQKYRDGGRGAAIDFMKRDANATESHGQHVADAFHLSDFFIDNTVDRHLKTQLSNPDWDLVERLSRLVKIITYAELERPTIAETAMHHAFSTQRRCVCRQQVGAALVDKVGNIIATGTNEVPKAGGGVYGESFAPDSFEGRCAMFSDTSKRYCRNTTEQNSIIDELMQAVPELSAVNPERKEKLSIALRKTRIREP